tara:strand:- start:101 stop:487 length:387 start_codon:yes stop_codon:yes gene_type:complete
VLSYKELHLNKGSTVSSINRLDDEIVLVFDENCSLELELVGIRENLIENYKPQKIYLYAKPLTNALKKIDKRGNVIENLNREEYLEVYTPLICKSKYIENYFKENKYWVLDKFIRMNEGKVEFNLLNL